MWFMHVVRHQPGWFCDCQAGIQGSWFSRWLGGQVVLGTHTCGPYCPLGNGWLSRGSAKEGRVTSIAHPPPPQVDSSPLGKQGVGGVTSFQAP